MAGIDISNLETELKQHLADNPAIFGMHFAPVDDQFNFFTTYKNVEDKQILYNLNIGDPNQPGNRASHAHKDIIEWENRTLEVQNGEVTLKFTQAELLAYVNSHIAMITKDAHQGQINNMPYEEFILQKVLERSGQYLRKLGLWKGVKNSAGTTSADIFNGLLTVLATAITDGDVPAGNVFAGAPITSSNAVAQFTGVRDKVVSENPDYINEPLVLFCAPENALHYNENYKAINDSLPYNTGFNKTALEGLGNCSIVSERGMTGSDRLVLTTIGNCAYGDNSELDSSSIDIQKNLRNYDLMMDFKAGAEFALTEEIWTNDQV